MAREKHEHARGPDKPDVPDWQAAVDRAAHGGTEITQGDWAKFPELGDHVIGRVIEISGPTLSVKNGFVRLETVDGVVVPVGLGGNLSSLLRDRGAELRGQIISIWFIAQDAPKQAGKSGLKRYRVIVHGTTFPEWAIADFGGDDDLPF